VETSGADADLTPPELADGIIIDPALGKDGTVFTVCFSAKEDLDQDPIVQVDTGAGLANLTRREDIPALCDGSSWAYSYTADISKDAAGTRVLSVNLVDKALNRADGLALGSFELDFIAPELSGGIALAPSPAKVAEEVTLSFSLDEVVQNNLRVYMQSGDETRDWIAANSPDDGYGFTYLYTPTADDPHK
jgi:hypothetical protein